MNIIDLQNERLTENQKIILSDNYTINIKRYIDHYEVYGGKLLNCVITQSTVVYSDVCEEYKKYLTKIGEIDFYNKIMDSVIDLTRLHMGQHYWLSYSQLLIIEQFNNINRKIEINGIVEYYNYDNLIFTLDNSIFYSDLIKDYCNVHKDCLVVANDLALKVVTDFK